MKVEDIAPDHADWCCRKGCPGMGNAIHDEPWPCDGTRCTCGEERVEVLLLEVWRVRVMLQHGRAKRYQRRWWHRPQYRCACGQLYPSWVAWDQHYAREQRIARLAPLGEVEPP